MHAILPFLMALARSNGIAFLAAFGALILFCAPFIWRGRAASRRYLLHPPNSRTPEGRDHMAGFRTSLRPTTGRADAQGTGSPTRSQEGGHPAYGSTSRLPTRQPIEQSNV